ncbi:MAG: hypothetical protein KAT62_03575 [Desulfuromonadales bacterium]|nr:hypothetical protein [Desulfuromonadales bacterium]
MSEITQACNMDERTNEEKLLCRINALTFALEEAKCFAEWIEILGRTDCEIYKHELKGSADLSLDRINKVLGI